MRGFFSCYNESMEIATVIVGICSNLITWTITTIVKNSQRDKEIRDNTIIPIRIGLASSIYGRADEIRVNLIRLYDLAKEDTEKQIPETFGFRFHSFNGIQDKVTELNELSKDKRGFLGEEEENALDFILDISSDFYSSCKNKIKSVSNIGELVSPQDVVAAFEDSLVAKDYKSTKDAINKEVKVLKNWAKKEIPKK